MQVSPAARVALWIAVPDDIPDAQRFEEILPGKLELGHAGRFLQDRGEDVHSRAVVAEFCPRFGNHRAVQSRLYPVGISSHCLEGRLVTLVAARFHAVAHAYQMPDGDMSLAVVQAGNCSV